MISSNRAGELADKWIYVLGGMMLEPQPANAVIAIGVPTERHYDSLGGESQRRQSHLVAATGSTTFSIKKNGT